MLEHTPQAAAAITADERVFAHRLMVDWARDGQYAHPLSDLSRFVQKTSRDGTLSSTAPEEMMLVEGYAATSLPIVLSGTTDDGQSLAAQFSPYNGRSVFYAEGLPLGAAMYYDLAVWTSDGWEWFRQFTGIVREPDVDRVTGEVHLECLDNVEENRGPVDVPPYGLWQQYLQQGLKRGMLVDSSSLIDLAARAGGFTMGPARFPWWPPDWGDNASMIFSAPLHGSVLPEIGMLDNYQEFHRTEQWESSGLAEERNHSEAYNAGPHGYLALAALPDTPSGADMQENIYWCDDTRGVAGSPEGTWVLAAWVNYDGDRNEHAFARVVKIRIRQNEYRLIVECPTGRVWGELQERDGAGGNLHIGPALTMPSQGWHYLEVAFEVDAGPTFVEMRTRIDDEQTPITRVTDTYPGIDNDQLSGLVTIEKVYGISDVTIFWSWYVNALDPGFYSRDITPLDTARVSWGRNRIHYTTREHGREAWDLAKEVAAAEYGAVFFDEYGRFVFWNYDDVTARAAQPVRTFTVDTLASLGMRATVDSIRNVWTVTSKSGRARPGIAYDLGDDGEPMFESGNGQLYPSDFILPATSQFNEFFIPVDDHVIAVEPRDVPYLAESAPWGQHGPLFGCIHWDNNNGAYLSSLGGPASEQKMISRDLFRLAISNGYNAPATFVSPDGQPRFRVQGTVVYEDLERTWTIRDEDSIATYGERVIELDGTWLQDEFQTRAMLAELVAKMGRPIPVTDNVTVPGDPRIQIGDTIEVRDRDGFGESMLMQIYGIRREVTAEAGLTDTYTVEMLTAPGEGVWDSPSYGVWDRSLIWS